VSADLSHVDVRTARHDNATTRGADMSLARPD